MGIFYLHFLSSVKCVETFSLRRLNLFNEQHGFTFRKTELFKVSLVKAYFTIFTYIEYCIASIAIASAPVHFFF
jgi:hypothetical protein